MTDIALAASPKRRSLATRIGTVLGVAALAAVAWRGWALRGQVAWRPATAGELATIAASVALQALVLAGGVALWGRMLRASGDAPRPFAALLGHWSWAHLARYVPGGVWQLLGMAAGAARAERRPAAYVAAFLVQAWVGIVSAALVACVTLPLARPSLRWLALAAPLALLLAHPAPIRLALALARRVGAAAVPWTGGWTEGVRLVAANAVLWLLSGAAFWLLARAITGVAPDQLLTFTGINVTAFLAGAIVVFVPAGLGVREATLGALLTPSLGAPAALVVALASRVWGLAAELVTAMAGAVLARRAEWR